MAVDTKPNLAVDDEAARINGKKNTSLQRNRFKYETESNDYASPKNIMR